MKKLFQYIIVLALLAAVAVLGVQRFSGESSGGLSLRTAKITRGSILEVVTANGTLNPVEVVTVGAQVSGQITNLYVDINDQVKKGQLLAEIDPLIPETELRQSKASMETAKLAFEQAARDLERTRTLVAKDFLARVELERAEQSYLSARNSYDVAKSQVERAEVNLGYTKITSPIDGVIIAQEVTRGQTLTSTYQTPNLFRIAGDLREMKIDVNFPESDISKIKKGQKVIFTVDAFPDKEFDGEIDLVNLNPTPDQGIVTYRVVVKVDNKERLLLPGMTAYVTVTLTEIKNVLRVPAAALRFNPPPAKESGFSQLFQPSLRGAARLGRNNKPEASPGKSIIYILKNGQLTPTEVTAGKSDNSYVAITGPVSAGDTVVIGAVQSR